MKSLFYKNLFWGLVLCSVCIIPNIAIANTTSNSGSSSSNNTASDGEDAECSTKYVVGIERDFVPVLRCQWFHPGLATYASPLFADIDGDGQTEVVATLQHSTDGFAVIDPTNCEPEHQVAVGGDVWLKDGGPVLGDVDHDGYVDIFMEVNTTIQRWEYNPETETIEKVWETPFGVSTAARSHLDIWDINQDGVPELIPNMGQMVDAMTGYVYPGTLPYLHWEAKGLFAFTADAIPGQAPEGQGNVELIYGTHIYRYDFTNEEWLEIKAHPEVDWGFVANVSLADVDLDGDVDAVMSNWDNQGRALIWDLQTDELIGGGIFDYPGSKGSRFNIANMDEDEYPEMVMTSEFRVFAIDDVVTSGHFGEIAWLDITSDESGHTQMTSFDFDGNGTYEVIYRDETRLRIFSGMGTGVSDGQYRSSPRVLLDSGDEELCISFTGMEYPTIGDVDNDDQAEIIAVCHNYVKIYESGSLPWADASAIWNTQAFNVTNVNQDGTIPAVPVENYKIYNNFLAQVNDDEPQDTIIFKTPDAVIEIEDIVNQCDGTFKVNMMICNQGASFLPNGTPVALYWGTPEDPNPEFIQSLSLEEVLQQGNCREILSHHIVAPQEARGLFAVINDDGQGVLSFAEIDMESGEVPESNIYECNYANNVSLREVNIDPLTHEVIQAEICAGEQFIVEDQAFSEAGTYQLTVPSPMGCDHMITLELEVLPELESEHEATICAGESYTFNGIMYMDQGLYIEEVESETGCKELVYFELTVLPGRTEELVAELCEGETVEFNGTTYSAAGTYQDVFQTDAGCDSVLTITINMLPTQEEVVEAIICAGETYEYEGQTYTATGTYTQVLQTESGCEKTVELNLTVLDPVAENESVTLCSGESYEFNGQTYNETGVYTQNLQTEAGCEKVVTLTVDVLPKTETSEQISICAGETYSFNGQELAESGLYEYTETNENGCEAHHALELNVTTAIEERLEARICAGQTYSFAGVDYTEAGVYTNQYTSASGCDSIVTLSLEITPQFVDQFTTTICEGEIFEYRGKTYAKAGTYEESFQSNTACDSLIEITVEVVPTTRVSKQVEICPGESYGGYTESGTYTQVVRSAAGCDSIMEIELTIRPEVNLQMDAKICSGESYYLNGTVYDKSGQYTAYLNSGVACDTLVTLNLEVLKPSKEVINQTLCEGEVFIAGDQHIEEGGIYTCNFKNQAGCDSIVEFHVELEARSEVWGTDMAICAGEKAQLEVFGGTDYNWYPENGLSCVDCPNPVASPNYTTTYYVTTEGCNGAAVETAVTVEVFDKPYISLTTAEEITINRGESIELGAQASLGSLDISWEANNKIICGNCSSILVSPDKSTAYIASVITDDGCVSQKEVKVFVKDQCIVKDDFFIPNMISPNGDGVNDFFYVQTQVSDVRLRFLRIYNRWGEMMFESNDYDKQWDGTHKGQAINPGVYVYYMEVVCPNGKTSTEFGNVTVIK